MKAELARSRFESARVARLATVGPDGHPHLVPLVFCLLGETIYSAVDAKPKRTTALRRLSNVKENPAVSLLVDHYDDADWDALWWVRADGYGRVLAADEDEAERATDALAERYRQHRAVRPNGPVLAVDVTRWSGWSASGGR